VTILSGLLKGAYSLARSHYCPTRKLLAARFPSWPGSLLLRQPGLARFLRLDHLDAGLSTDTCSTQATIQQDSWPQASHFTKPPSSRITGMRHIPGEQTSSSELYMLQRRGRFVSKQVGRHLENRMTKKKMKTDYEVGERR